MAEPSMQEFWDARAREDPFYFVDNRLDYRGADLERFWSGGREALDTMLGLLGVKLSPSDSVVEIGCGVGRITRVLAERVARVWAVDVSERMLEVAREENPGLDNVEWLLGDGRSLSAIETRSADVCHSHVTFQHIPDPGITFGYVREMGRVLGPGGWSAFQVSNSPHLHRQRSLAERARGSLLSLLGRAPRGQSHPAWLGSATDLDRLREVAAAAGMDVERVVGAGTPHCLVLLRKRAG